MYNQLHSVTELMYQLHHLFTLWLTKDITTLKTPYRYLLYNNTDNSENLILEYFSFCKVLF